VKKSITAAIIVLVYFGIIVSLFFMNKSTLFAIYSFVGIENDNWLHVPAFFVLAFLVRLMFSSRIFGTKNPLFYSAVISIVLGVVLEVLHIYVPSRTFNPMDMLLNLFGISLYIAIDFVVEKHLIQRIFAARTIS